MVKSDIKEIEKEILKILKKIDKDFDMTKKIDIDSLTFIRFVMEIEKRFKFKLSPSEMFDKNFNQISHIAKVIKSK